MTWRGIYRVNDGGSRRRGVAGSPCWMCGDGSAQIGCVVWHRGNVDGRPNKVIAFISLEDGYAEDGSSDFSACACGARQVSTGPVGPPS